MRSRSSRGRCCGSRPSTETMPLVRVAVALEDLDGRRLAGAVGPEQPEDLARATSKSIPRTASMSP